MKEDIFEKKFMELYNFLGMFAGYADIERFDATQLIREHYLVNERMIQISKVVINQAVEVLTLEPFPEELIGDITNTVSLVQTRKEWLQKLVQILIDQVNFYERKHASSSLKPILGRFAEVASNQRPNKKNH